MLDLTQEDTRRLGELLVARLATSPS